jgi:hypothetical protein
VFSDLDRNGIDDDLEREVATRNVPTLALDPGESCGAPRGVVYTVRHHPDAPARLSIVYVVLYTIDCGPVNGHLGDNEAFAITVDLGAAPGPPATVGVLTDAHRNTTCESISTCEAAPGTGACADPAVGRVIIYSSRNKHANYFSQDACDINCLDQCAPGLLDTTPRLLDVGSSEAPLSHDLTADGLIVDGDGWDPALLHFDPWSAGTFGDAGHVDDQLLKLVAPAGK